MTVKNVTTFEKGSPLARAGPLWQTKVFKTCKSGPEGGWPWESGRRSKQIGTEDATSH